MLPVVTMIVSCFLSLVSFLTRTTKYLDRHHGGVAQDDVDQAEHLEMVLDARVPVDAQRLEMQQARVQQVHDLDVDEREHGDEGDHARVVLDVRTVLLLSHVDHVCHERQRSHKVDQRGSAHEAQRQPQEQPQRRVQLRQGPVRTQK